jgi:hypothetical protein
MGTRPILDVLIELEERAARLYTHFYGRFFHMPAVAGLWWEMALEEYEHAGVLKMVRQLANPRSRPPRLQARLRPVEEAIRGCERALARDVSLGEALAMAVRLERSELDRLGQETLRAVGGGDRILPAAAFAPHAAHLARLMRTVRKFGGEEVAREAWGLDAGSGPRRGTPTPGGRRAVSAGPSPGRSQPEPGTARPRRGLRRGRRPRATAAGPPGSGRTGRY